MGLHKKGYLPTLDGWRAVAIFAVIADHASGYSIQARFPRVFAVTRIGPNGVSLFFAISGFLITSRLLEEFDTFGKISLRGFYIRRGSRILPAAMAYLAILGLLGMCGIVALSPVEWWSSVLFWRNYLPPALITRGWGGYTIHYWSLAVEEHFYLIWPALLVLSGPRKSKWVAAGLALVVACWRSWDFHHQFIEHHVAGLLFASRTDVRLDGLFLGCLAALLAREQQWRGFFRRISRPPLWLLLVIAYFSVQIYYRRHYYTILESALLAAIVAGTVLRPETLFGRVLELRWMRWVGRLSYSLYLWQQLLLLPGAKSPWGRLQHFPLNLVLLIAIAALSYEFIERPLIRLGHRLAPPPTPGREDVNVADEKEDRALASRQLSASPEVPRQLT